RPRPSSRPLHRAFLSRHQFQHTFRSTNPDLLVGEFRSQPTLAIFELLLPQPSGLETGVSGSATLAPRRCFPPEGECRSAEPVSWARFHHIQEGEGEGPLPCARQVTRHLDSAIVACGARPAPRTTPFRG